MLGVVAADLVDEAVSGGAVQPCDTFPDALCAGCLCMCCIHGTRLCVKAHEDRKAKEEREANQRAALGIGGQRPMQGVPLDRGYDEEPVEGKPLVSSGITRGTRGIAAGSGYGNRSQLSTSTVRRTRGVAQNLGHSALDDPADDAWAWEERNRRSQIADMFNRGGRPDDEANRHLFEQRPRGDESQVSGAPSQRVSRRDRSLPSIVSGDTADMQSQSHVSQSQYGGQSYVSERAPRYDDYGDGSRVAASAPYSAPPASPPKSGVRLGVGGGTGWSDGY